MSRACAYIKFTNSGNLYFGGYCGTCDYMKSHILPITKENVDKYAVSDICLDGIKFYYEFEPDVSDDDYKEMCKNSSPCEIYSTYGGGFYWEAFGYERGEDTFSVITKRLSPYYGEEAYESMVDGEPDWMDEVRAAI